MGNTPRRKGNLRPFRFVSRRGIAQGVRLAGRPRVEHPLMLVAFEGWNDAADAASYALTNLSRAWQAASFAEIDAEEFFDFTETRPELTVVAGLVREITWPATVFSAAPGPVDVVFADRNPSSAGAPTATPSLSSPSRCEPGGSSCSALTLLR